MNLDEKSLFEVVESSIIQKYNNLNVKGDVDNSVLAGFLLYDSFKKELSVISLATGTKVMSGDQREKTAKIGPVFLHDCHAEVLSHRAFQVWLWENMNNREVFDEHGNLKENISFHFYSSTPPCGDCSVHNINGSVSVQTGSKPFGSQQSDLLSTPPNIVRGKPGRGSRSQSVSCSDKICLWLNCGIEGSLLSNFITGIKIDSVSIGNGNLESIKRALFKRVENDVCTKICVGESKWVQKNESPCASSLVWWNGAKKPELIAAKYGRKLGVIPKRQEEPNFYSLLCDASMLTRYLNHEHLDEIKLKNAKDKSTEYNNKKKNIKQKLTKYGYDWAAKFPDEKEWVLKLKNM